MERIWKSSVVLICVTMLGCGSGSLPVKLYPAKGTVTYQGKPVTDCVITLVPVTPIKGVDVAFMGKLSPEGKFQLASSPGSKAGAAVGKYKVVLSLPPEEAMKAMMKGGGKKGYQAAQPFPKEFSSAATTKKEVEITAGSNDLLIEL